MGHKNEAYNLLGRAKSSQSGAFLISSNDSYSQESSETPTVDQNGFTFSQNRNEKMNTRGHKRKQK